MYKVLLHTLPIRSYFTISAEVINFLVLFAFKKNSLWLLLFPNSHAQ